MASKKIEPWSAHDDKILRYCWPNKKITLEKIKSLLRAERTDHALRNRAGKLCLGPRPAETRGKPGPVPAASQNPMAITPWPDDMPQFEDHPDAAKPSRGGNVVKKTKRYQPAKTYHQSEVGGGNVSRGGIPMSARFSR